MKKPNVFQIIQQIKYALTNNKNKFTIECVNTKPPSTKPYRVENVLLKSILLVNDLGSANQLLNLKK